ncbi:hypothetical protein V5799_017412, partial [Amblyomma americanum]
MSTVSTTLRPPRYNIGEEVKFDVVVGSSLLLNDSYRLVRTRAVVLKKVQRRIHFPYTLFMFIAGVGFSYKDKSNESINSLSMWLRNIKFHVLMVFVPAATVYATQGINHFIFR